MSAICAWREDAIHFWNLATGESEGFDMVRFTQESEAWMPCPEHLYESQVMTAETINLDVWLPGVARFAASRGVEPERYCGQVMEIIRPYLTFPA